jgi:hypothetical protein
MLALILALSTFAYAGKPKPPPELPAETQVKIKKLCSLVRTCTKDRAEMSTVCVKSALKEAGFLNHVIENAGAKDFPRQLRREGFTDVELIYHSFSGLPDGAILVLDEADPFRDRKPQCPQGAGKTLVKCEGQWVAEKSYDLEFHVQRGCRSKGIWLAPSLMPPPDSKL